MLTRYVLSSCVCLSVCLSVCMSVRLSQAGIVSKRLDESSWFLARRLPSTYPTLCYKEIWVHPKIRLLPCGTLYQTPDVENLATASRTRCQQLAVVVDGQASCRHRYDNRRIVAVYCKSMNCNPLTPLL